MGPALPFDRHARYGASVVAMVFGTYLAIATNFSAIVQSESYAGTIRTDVPLLNIAQFALVIVTIVTALALLPTSPYARLGGITLASVVLLVWATLGLERGAGNIREPVDLWAFVLNQGLVTLLASVGGWVIARQRHPLTWIVVVVAAAPAVIGPILDERGFTTGAYALIMQGTVGVLGLGAVWAAAGLDRLLARRSSTR